MFPLVPLKMLGNVSIESNAQSLRFPAMKQQDSNSQDTGRLLTLQHPSLLTRAPEPACPPIQWQEEDLHACAAAWSLQENCHSNHRVPGRELGSHVFQSPYYAQGRPEVHLDVVVFPESNSFNHPRDRTSSKSPSQAVPWFSGVWWV